MNSEAAGTEYQVTITDGGRVKLIESDGGKGVTVKRTIGEWTPDELAEVIARNVQPSPDRISIEVFQSDWRPGFAALLDDGSLAEGAPAHVILNIGSLLSAVESKDLDSRDLPYLIAETLMHEVIHCLESWAKVEFSEDRVEELLTKYREKYARAMIWEYTGAPPHEAENPQEARPVPQPATEPDGEKK